MNWILADALVNGGATTERCLVNLARLTFITPDEGDEGQSYTVVTVPRDDGETMNVCLTVPFETVVALLDPAILTGGAGG